MTKQFIEILLTGSFVANSLTREIKDRSNPGAIPDNAFGYQFYDIEEVESGGEVLRGQPKNKSPKHYFGEAFTLDDVKREFPNEKNLIWNMECNRWNKVVKTRLGNFQPFESTDVLIPS